MSAVAPPAGRASTAQATRLVAAREIRAKLRSRTFLVSSLLLLVLALAAVLWGGLGGQETTIRVAAPAAAAAALRDVPALELVDAADRADAERLVREGAVDAAVVVDPASPVGLTIVAERAAPPALAQSLAAHPDVELLDPEARDPLTRYLVAFGFGLVFFLAAMMFGATIAASVVEEKQTRIVEILISTIPARILLAGKVLGNTALAMGQILSLAAVAALGLAVTGRTGLLADLGAPVAWFAVFFLFGFVLTAALFAATGAMVSRQEDIGSTTGPVTSLVMAPYLVVVFFNDDPAVMRVMSYVPFSAPVGMPVRVFFDEAAWWEPLASLAVLLSACAAVIAVGARIYENSLLRMGGRVRLRDALGR